MSILKEYNEIKENNVVGYDKALEKYDDIIRAFSYNKKLGCFTHFRHLDAKDYRDVTDKFYRDLGKVILKIKLATKTENSRVDAYNFIGYTIPDLVVTISKAKNDIDIYNLYKKMGLNPKSEYNDFPFREPSLYELQLYTIKAIIAFYEKSLENFATNS